MLLVPAFLIGLACGWDYDTIQMERKAFPNIYELIAGKFLRHSKEFYYWRAKDRERQLKIHPDSLPLYDDLGVALDKIGEHKKAIQTMLKSDSIQSGRYETYANLGTFYIHNHQFEEGAHYIEKAIEINPEAHFGREVYQLHLVRYIIEKTNGKAIELPLASKNNQDNFYNYLYKHHIKSAIQKGSTKEAEIAKAIKGLAGMMHFGQYRSPILLECLGDLLLQADTYGGAGHLGARAYLKAAFESKNADAIKAYERKTTQALEMVRPFDFSERGINIDSSIHHLMMNDTRPIYQLKHLKKALKLEIYRSEQWFHEIKSLEKKWITSGINADSAFKATYFDDIEPLQYTKESRIDENIMVTDSAWLAIQLENPPFEDAFLGQDKLDDAAKARIDSLFNKMYPPVVKDPTPDKKNDEAEKEEGGNSSALWYFAFALIAIGIYMVWKDYQKNKKA